MIRKFEKDDIHRVLEIYNSYVRETTFTLDLDPSTTEEMMLQINYSKYAVVLVEDGIVMGYGYISSFSKKPGYDITGVLTIYLDQYKQGSGYGKKILKALEQAAPQFGVKQLYAIISHTNDRSLEFFKRNGYEEVACFDRVAFKHGQQIDVFYLRNMLK